MAINMTLNEHVNVDTTISVYIDKFYPDDGYALWDDTETGNLDENGEPMQYYLQSRVPKHLSEARAPHIWARLIDDTMEVYGKTNPEQPAVMSLKARAAVATITTDDESTLTETTSSHTYIDENGVERPKRGVY